MMLEESLIFWVADTNIQRAPLFITLYNYFKVGNVLLCVIYQWKFTVFVYVTRISRYITLYIAFGIISCSRKRGSSWNLIPADTGVRLYIEWAWTLEIITVVLYVRRADTATMWNDQLFVLSLHSLVMSPA